MWTDVVVLSEPLIDLASWHGGAKLHNQADQAKAI